MKRILSFFWCMVFLLSCAQAAANAEKSEYTYDLRSTTSNGAYIWNWDNQMHSSPRADAGEFYAPFGLTKYKYPRPSNWEFFDISDNFLEYAKTSEWESDDNVRIYADGVLVTEGVENSSVSGSKLPYIKGGAGARHIFVQWNQNENSATKVWHGRTNSNETCQLGEACSLRQEASHTHTMGYTIGKIGVAFLLDAPPEPGAYSVSFSVRNSEYFSGKASAWIAPYVEGEYDMKYYMTEANFLSGGHNIPATNATSPNRLLDFGVCDFKASEKYVLVLETTTDAISDIYNYYVLTNITLTPHSHHYKGAWKPHDATHHKKVCKCGVAMYAPHDWLSVYVDKLPTYEEAGVKRYECYSCVDVILEELPKLTEKGKVSVGSVRGRAGETVDVDVLLLENPGITSMLLNLSYNEDYLTLLSVDDGGLFSDFDHSDNLSLNPYILSWSDDLIEEEKASTGKLATLKFKIAENAPGGSFPITLSYNNENDEIYNKDFYKLDCVIENGNIDIGGAIIGDVTGDGVVNAFDRTTLARYVAQWTEYPASSLDLSVADVNNDKTVNTFDRTILARHVAMWTGYEILPLG